MMGATISATVDYDPQANVVAPSPGAVGTDGASGEGFTVAIAHESGLTIGGGATKVGNTDARLVNQVVLDTLNTQMVH